MSDQQNPQGKNVPLPGLGPKLGSSPLPGLGGAPGAAPLPGLGAKSPLGAAPLPGARPSAPPMPARPSAPPGAFPGLGARGPAVGQVPRPSAPPPAYIPESIAPPAYDASIDPSTTASSSTPQKVVLGFLCIAMLFIGYNVGKAWSNRVQLNISLRDSMVVQYEVDKAMRLFDELDAVMNGAVLKANKYEYEPKHVEYLATNFKECPIKPQLFTERSYKNFGRKASTALSNYGMKWAGLMYVISDHVQKTRAEEAELKGTSDKLQQILKSQYGLTFQRKGQDLFANVVYIGKPEEKKGKVLIPVGAKPAPTEDPREAFNPPGDGSGDEGAFTEAPESYVMLLSPEAGRGLLAGRSKEVFNEYVVRLDDIRAKMKMMRDEQTSLTRMLAELASQEPAAIAPPDSEAEFRTYAAQDGKAAAAPAPGK